MKREFLTGELGLSKETTDKIMAQYGESVNKLRAEAAQARSDNEQLTDTLAALKEEMKGSAAQSEQLAALSEENEQLLADLAAAKSALSESRLSGAVTAALTAAGAKNVKAAGALLDKTTISLNEDGSLQGLSEQIDAMKQTCGYLFYDQFASTGMRHAPAGAQQDGFTHYARAGAKLN